MLVNFWEILLFLMFRSCENRKFERAEHHIIPQSSLINITGIKHQNNEKSELKYLK